MSIDIDFMDDDWLEDLGGQSLDDLRDLPFAVQAGLDTSIWD